MKKIKLSIIFLLSSSLFGNALIRDVESLRNSLPVNDPSRKALTLKLADLYFDHSVELGQSAPDAGQHEKVLRARKNALKLYRIALKGTSHYSAVSGDQAWKVRFQIGRLLQDLGETEEANQIWTQMSEQQSIPQLQRESTLRLAEYYDKKGNFQLSDKYYQRAFDLCAGGDVCSYIHYRRAWLLRNHQQLEPAINAMKQALYDSKGQVREEALRDLITFIADRRGNGEDSLVYVEKLAGELKRPELVEKLSTAFFSAGNRQAGTLVLAHLNSRSPSLKSQIRLLEEYYGSRKWDSFRQILEDLETASAQTDWKSNEEKILRRLTVQLDGERMTSPEHRSDFQKTVRTYLNLFPSSEHTYKMIQGWAAAESQPTKKIAQLQTWSEAPQFSLDASQRTALEKETKALSLELHRDLAAKAQKSNDHRKVVSEMDELIALDTDAKKQREYQYMKARALLSLKLGEEALPIFQELASTTGKPDQWAIQSQHLALEILNQQKNYDGILKQSAQWTQDKEISALAKSDAKLRKEVSEFEKIEKQARFEKAVSENNTPESLAIFHSYCQAKDFFPKSCENAKILSIKLNDQQKLIASLRQLGAKQELAAELEAAGYFAEAAKVTESLSLKPDSEPKTFLKIALLYELGGQLIERNRLILALTRKLKKQKTLGELEGLLFVTLTDTGLLGPEALELPWSDDRKAEVASRLEAMGTKNKTTKRILLSSLTEQGAPWKAHVLEHLQALDKQQRSVKFYGSRSQQRFGLRLKKLKAFVADAEKYFPGASIETRKEIAILLKKAHEDLGQEILDTPIPKELNEAAVAEVKLALQKMADPFIEKAQGYDQLSSPETKMAESTDQGTSEQPLAKAETSIARTGIAGIPDEPLDQTDRDAYLSNLHQNPSDKVALEGVKKFYQQKGNARLVAYFEGRLQQLHSNSAPKEGTL